ncbi:hypothetical protein KOW79_022581 [Hemibagrus wyckioides]|uniref:Uncharacterized protein n=1 Tax=Hemibagrus wyckioides TaxID=337641 RepID=A0A9D3N411_9TELE|nr:uncharacterized protein si:cabz01007807.1 [Hemibagrus wyckioides]KAG7314085.1 hypothetical protein KOW79_022581 [Hemibagrus wyckioides]
MEARDDPVGRQNEVASGERELTTVNGLSSTATNPFFTQGKDSNGNTVSRDNNKDFNLSHGQSNGWSHFLTSSTPSLENDWAVFPPPTLSQKTNQTTFPNQKSDTGQDSNSATMSAAGLSKQKASIFEPFKEETSITQRMEADVKTSEKRDYLLEYILANQKNDEESISPFTPFNHMEAFRDSSSFQTPESIVQNRVFQKIQLFQNPASAQNGNSHLSDNFAVHNGLFKPQDSHFDKIVQPTELSNGIFQESSKMPSYLNASTNGDMMFKRLPPKPTPRNKYPKNPDKSIDHDIFSTPALSVPADKKPAQTPFTPTLANPFSIPAVPQAKANIQDTTVSDKLNSSQVYEDILFIGQEKCVDDWPEDSPELSPEWKPSGKLKLRRESLRISIESEAALNTDTLGKKSIKKKKKLSLLRKGSKDKSIDDPMVLPIDTVHWDSKENYPDSLNGAYGDSLPWGTKYHASDEVFLPEEQDQNARMKSQSVKSKKTKFIVPHLKYKASKKKSLDEVFETGSPFLQASKSEQTQESYEDMLRNSDQKEPVMKDWRMKEPMKFKPSVSHRLSKDSVEDDLKKMNGLSFLEESKENVRAGNESHHFSADLLAEYQREQFSPKSSDGSGKIKEVQDYRKKRSTKFSVPRVSLKGSKSTLENDIPQKGADLFKASDIKELENNLPEDYSQKKEFPVKASPIIPKVSTGLSDADIGADLFKAGDIEEYDWTEKHTMDVKKEKLKKARLPSRESKGLNDADKGADLFKAGDIEEYDWTEKHTMDVKKEKLKKARLPSRESKARDQLFFPEDIEPPGATSGDYYLSEAAKAEWMSSQMDVRRARAPYEDEELEAVKEEVDGDTDSLMEWWNTVELWDELPDEELSLKEDETKSFTQIADKVHQGLRVFYKLFTEHAEVLYQHVLRLYTIADDISNFHRRAKIANITGGTTTAVGGVAAITGLALAPVTFGASLIVSAVGLGVATAGGITAASASISDNVHDMNDRKKIEVVGQDYETRLAELRRCLHFVAEGIRRMRFHPLLRRNNYYAGDWEVRRALQTLSLVGEPVEHAEDIVEKSTVALKSVCKGMDNYFSKDSKELKKGCKKDVTMQVNMLAKLLHEDLVALNSIREQLMEAMGHV